MERVRKVNNQISQGPSASSTIPMRSAGVYILSAMRTPVGAFGGSLKSVSSVKLGSTAISAAVAKAGVKPEDVDEVFMGNVLSANLGQAPARQAALGANIPVSVPCTTVNKVCASGMKSVIFGAQSIQLCQNDVVVVGGMESMSNVPYYDADTRWGARMMHKQITDGMIKDGLWDCYGDQHMGTFGDLCAKTHNISREDQDSYARLSFERALSAINSGASADEIVPVEVPQRRGNPIIVSSDESPLQGKLDKLPSLRPAFGKDGTVTAGNASSLSDGAAALVLASKSFVDSRGLQPIAEIVSYADAAQKPELFTTAPAIAVPKALSRAGLSTADLGDRDYIEINEAFSVVALANQRLLDLSPERVNVRGGGVSVGHPLGCSGARILVTLCSILRERKGRYGVAGICNGGGGASAMVIKV